MKLLSATASALFLICILSVSALAQSETRPRFFYTKPIRQVACFTPTELLLLYPHRRRLLDREVCGSVRSRMAIRRKHARQMERQMALYPVALPVSTESPGSSQSSPVSGTVPKK